MTSQVVTKSLALRNNHTQTGIQPICSNIIAFPESLSPESVTEELTLQLRSVASKDEFEEPVMFTCARGLKKFASNEILPPECCGDVVEFDNVRVDFVRFEASRSTVPVALTALQYKVLKFFFSNPHRVISREELLETVWGYDHFPTIRTVDNQILHLRKKLEMEPANPNHFRTVHGVGYKFVP